MEAVASGRSPVGHDIDWVNLGGPGSRHCHVMLLLQLLLILSTFQCRS